MAQLKTIQNKIYDNRRLKVDGGRFIRCRFINSKIIYYAEQEVSFEECTFEECDWIFEDSADRALRYLAMLQRQGGDDGKAVVAATVDAFASEIYFAPIDTVAAAS